MTPGPGPPGRARAAALRLAEILLPPACAGCGAGTEPRRAGLCPLCESRLSAVPPPLCPRCGLTRTGAWTDPAACPECEDWPPELPRAAAPFLHEGVARAMVTALKYRGCFGLAPVMAAAMEREARRVVSGGGDEEASDVALVPVPLAPARRRERGYNQARLLADALSSRTGWPVVGLLSRSGSGPSQASLGRRDRASVGASGFAVRTGSDGPVAPRSARLLLVDDVVTTGSTAAACARALAASSQCVVGVVSFTRAPPGLPGS